MTDFVQPFDYLVRSTERMPDAIAISMVDVDLTYAELLDTALRFAVALREAGVQPGNIVGVRAPTLVQLVMIYAVFHEAAVGAIVPVGHLSEGPDDGASVFDWVVTDVPLAHYPSDRQIVLDAPTLARVASTDVSAEPRSYASVHDVCRVVFSSGTTGRPKAIPYTIDVLKEKCLESRLRWMLQTPFMSHFGLASIVPLLAFYSAIAVGETFIFPAATEDEVISQLQRHRVRTLSASPHQMNVFVNAVARSQAELPDLQALYVTGSALPEFLGRRIDQILGVRLVVAYASSEAGTMARREGSTAPAGYSGVVEPDVSIQILDDAGRPVDDGITGRVAVKRERHPQRYLGRETDSSTTFVDGYFLTGDTGWLEGDRLYLAGRASEIINAAGVKIDPARIDDAVLAFPGIDDAGAFGFTDARGLETVGLVFVSPAQIDMDGLLAHLRAHLGDSAPSHIARVSVVPRTATGKVVRDEAARLFSNRPAIS